MIILFSTNPTRPREIDTTHKERSLFRDVIESLRIHSQLPEDINQNDENNLSQNFIRFGYENEPSHLASDADYIPRRNDRIEMPTLKYRFPKNLDVNSSEEIQPREEVVVFIDTNKHKSTTPKPKKKPTRPQLNKIHNQNRIKENEEEENTDNETDDYNPSLSNTMAGQSHIGNRESQTVLKPTVIVNIRGSVNHRDSDIRIESRDEDAKAVPLHNIFNINQEIKIEKEGNKKKPANVKQEIHTVPEKANAKVEEDMMMCETATAKQELNQNQENRKFDNVLQILLSI